MNWFEKLFGKKEAKDKIKKNHQSCDFGIKEFNKNKRSRLFVEEIKLQEKKRRPSKPTDPTYPPPPPPPPPGVPERAVVLLVFNGAEVTGSSWNVLGELNLGHSGLTIEEQDVVLKAVQIDYSIFNIVSERITITNDPAVYNAAPYSRRSKIILTESYEWYGNGAGGVAFLNSFGSSTDNVGFVFTSLLGYIIKYIREAVSHEIGHQFGCYHQSVYDVNCVKIQEYNRGGNGKAPIMGIGYYEEEVDFIIGPCSLGCTAIQDDADVIRKRIG